MTTPNPDNLAPEVRQAIEEVREAFPNLTIEPDGDGGAYVTVLDATLAPIYQQRETWVGFHISVAYPGADVYPHFVREDLRRADGRPMGEGMSPSPFKRDKPAVRLSRRSNRWNPTVDTAAIKLQKVLEWLNSQP